MIKIRKNSSNGYVAISTAIILSAVFLLLFLETFVLSMGGMERVDDKEEFYHASLLINTCVEKALAEVRVNPDYDIETIYADDDSINCSIENVMRADNLISFEVSGESSGYKKSVEVEAKLIEEAGVRVINIIKWEVL